MHTITITLDPATNEVNVRSAISPAETVLTIERAKSAVMAHASKPRSAIEIAPADALRRLVDGDGG